jgi:membrane-bound inhibitor of C-type lysozyme
VNTTGFTKYDTAVVGGIDIEFAKDGSIKNNTAVSKSVTSNVTTGYYTIDLTPGSYNVTIEKKEVNTTSYTYDAKLVLTKGQGTKEYNINLTKKTVTVTGYTQDEKGNKIGGVSVKYEPDKSVINNTAVAPGTPTSNETTGLYTIELKPGIYNITASKLTASEYVSQQTLVYYCEKPSVNITNESKIIDITVSKKSVSVSGTVSYDGTKKANVTYILFDIDELVKDNTAIFNYVTPDKTDSYAVELKPGSYNISVYSDVFNISGVNYTYNISEDTDKLVVSDSQISTGVKPFNIKVEMKVKPD